METVNKFAVECNNVLVFTTPSGTPRWMHQANIGVVCLGGLVQMAVQFGKAFGMKLTVFNTSPNKRKDIGFNAYVIIVESS